MDIYLKSVGRGGVLLLNSTPNTDGRIPDDDAKRYREFGAEIQRRFGKPVARTSGVGETLELDLGGLRKVNQSWIMEDLRGGHRIRAYALEGRDAVGNWQPLATGISVGHKRIEVFPEITVDRLRLRVTKRVGTPIVRELAAFHAEIAGVSAVAAAAAKPVPCGKWAAGAARVTFDLTPHIKIPAAYEIVLRPGAESVTIRSAKLLFNSSEMPEQDCVVKDGKVIIRQTQQVTAQTKTELILEFAPGAEIPGTQYVIPVRFFLSPSLLPP
jgi:alpha-L-fucosidase